MSYHTAVRVLTLETIAVSQLWKLETLQDVDVAAGALYHALVHGSVIHVTGVGKSGFVAGKMAATLSSFSIPAFYLDPHNAFHGDMGCVKPKDMLIAISKSGANQEVCYLASRCPTIGITAVDDSPLAKASKHVVRIACPVEADVHEVAPTASTTAFMVVCDMIAVCLQELTGLSIQQFMECHPGGALGQVLREKRDQVLR